MNPYYAQGARCGHLEGKDRVGVYCIGEEYHAAHIATLAQGLRPSCFDMWFEGYMYGYKLAASGEALDRWIVEAPLP